MTEERPSPLRHDTDVVLPAAAYLRYEQRADGWSAGRQAACLAHLADNGIAADAVRSVGMSMQGSYALRRTARGYPFNMGWEAALIIARRIVTDELMTAAIRGEQSVWLREDGKTTFTRQNTRLSLTLLDRVNPATALPEVMAVAVRFDCFLMMIDDGLSAQQLWDYFFDDALAHDQIEARARVRAALQLSEESGGFEEEDGEEGEGEPPIEYKSMEGAPPLKRSNLGSHEATKTQRDTASGETAESLLPQRMAEHFHGKMRSAQTQPLRGFVSSCEQKSQNSCAVPRFHPRRPLRCGDLAHPLHAATLPS